MTLLASEIRNRDARLQDALAKAVETYGYTVADLRKKGRHEPLAWVRLACGYIVSAATKAHPGEVSRAFRRCRRWAHYSRQHVENVMATEPKVKAEIEQIIASIRNGR